jgi:4-amino-4-deoxy-L-arabinose transferase-like glycosyltransferase
MKGNKVWDTSSNWKWLCFLFIVLMLLSPRIFTTGFDYLVAGFLCLGMWYFWLIEREDIVSQTERLG